MLVLQRKLHEIIHVGSDITITVAKIGPASVRIGVTAPRDVKIMRHELLLEELGGEAGDAEHRAA